MKTTQDVFAQLSGQDDNLGDSALRRAYLEALGGEGRRLHVFLGSPTSDYYAAFANLPDVTFYAERPAWLHAQRSATRPVHAFNAGEINPQSGIYPSARRARECVHALDAGGALIVAGIGMKSVESVTDIAFDPVFRAASVMSWRDRGSRDAAGFGDYSPDWAYALGTAVEDWMPAAQRPLLAVTMRFDRAWPGEAWLAAVRGFAAATATRIVTVAQVARDAPRAVRLAEELGGDYLMASSMRHDALDMHVRDVYRRSLAVISDRAHGLIIGATEGAYPVGSGSDPQKIRRLVEGVGLGGLVGRYAEMPKFAGEFESHLPLLAPALTAARADLADLTARIRSAMNAVA